MAFTSTVTMLLYSSHSPILKSKKACVIILGVQSVSPQHFICSRYSLASDSLCHWPCTPSCFSFSTSFKNFFAFNLSQQKYSHIPCMYWSFSAFSKILQRCAFFSTTAHHCHFVWVASPFATKFFIVTLLTQVGRVELSTVSNNYRSKLPETEVLSLQRLSHQNIGRCVMLIAFGT